MAWEWLTGSHPPDPAPGELPTAEPDLSEPPLGAARVTWIGHATALVRLPGLTLLTDPVFSTRCTPVPLVGPRRFVPPVPALDALPPVDAVLLSHDHYDHLDRSTVKALARRFGEGLVWVTPLGYRDWLRGRGAERVVELDWWEDAPLPGGYRAVCLPARHWTRRSPWSTNTRLWSGWAVVPGEGGEVGAAGAAGAGGDVSGVGDGAADPAIPSPGRRRDTRGAFPADPAMDTPARGGGGSAGGPGGREGADPAIPSPARQGTGGDGPPADPAIPSPAGAPGGRSASASAAPRLYFAGDSAWCSAFRDIGERVGPFDVSLIPIGAYEPRWFMKASHVNPEEAVRIWAETGGRGAFVPIHWGTWRLTFEDPLEPPERLRTAWREAGLNPDALRILRHGETLTVRREG